MFKRCFLICVAVVGLSLASCNEGSAQIFRSGVIRSGGLFNLHIGFGYPGPYYGGHWDMYGNRYYRGGYHPYYSPGYFHRSQSPFWNSPRSGGNHHHHHSGHWGR